MANDLDESDHLANIQKYVDINKLGLLEFGDDAVAIDVNKGSLVINIDAWVASTDRPSGLPLDKCGYRATLNAISDIIAKGARPQYLVATISCPLDINVEMIAKGISSACAEYNIDYLGGDLNEANDLVIDICVFGFSDKIIKRSGAAIGDMIYWLGPEFGMTAAALGILVQGWKGDKAHSLEIMGNPKSYPEFLKMINTYEITASIDCSDGLAKSLYHLCKASNLGIELQPLNANIWAHKVSKENGKNVDDFILFGGEELGIIFSSPNVIQHENIQRIGKAIEGQSVRYQKKILENKGWQHFSD